MMDRKVPKKGEGTYNSTKLGIDLKVLLYTLFTLSKYLKFLNK